ncbi:HAD-IIB family hydrolase [Candidatus Daviesbacteria bacterium]|nr:HAD-IIB family hydrolase [Candidatus Daviesbacteria bacterium]
MTKDKQKRYKALILDVDGTLIPNKFEGMPSSKVTKYISLASKKIHIGVATSRCFPVTSHITEKLNLTGPSILCVGAIIMDVVSKTILWEKKPTPKTLKEILKKLVKLEVEFWICDNKEDKIINKKNYDQLINLDLKSIVGFYIPGIDPEKVEIIVNELSYIFEIAIQRVPSWNKGKIDLNISHALATKQHGVFEVAKILNIDTKEIIGVGDGYNDFPLLMACGLKVAMGNAVSDLKEIADYIAPSVEDDGVADIIEKFVLN